jgi:hypothetical protein
MFFTRRQVNTVRSLVDLCGKIHPDSEDICLTLLFGYITRLGIFSQRLVYMARGTPLRRDVFFKNFI